MKNNLKPFSVGEWHFILDKDNHDIYRIPRSYDDIYEILFRLAKRLPLEITIKSLVNNGETYYSMQSTLQAIYEMYNHDNIEQETKETIDEYGITLRRVFNKLLAKYDV